MGQQNLYSQALILVMIVPRICFQAAGLFCILLWKGRKEKKGKEHEQYTCRYGNSEETSANQQVLQDILQDLCFRKGKDEEP